MNVVLKNVVTGFGNVLGVEFAPKRRQSTISHLSVNNNRHPPQKCTTHNRSFQQQRHNVQLPLPQQPSNKLPPLNKSFTHKEMMLALASCSSSLHNNTTTQSSLQTKDSTETIDKTTKIFPWSNKAWERHCSICNIVINIVVPRLVWGCSFMDMGLFAIEAAFQCDPRMVCLFANGFYPIAITLDIMLRRRSVKCDHDMRKVIAMYDCVGLAERVLRFSGCRHANENGPRHFGKKYTPMCMTHLSRLMDAIKQHNAHVTGMWIFVTHVNTGVLSSLHRDDRTWLCQVVAHNMMKSTEHTNDICTSSSSTTTHNNAMFGHKDNTMQYAIRVLFRQEIVLWTETLGDSHCELPGMISEVAEVAVCAHSSSIILSILDTTKMWCFGVESDHTLVQSVFVDAFSMACGIKKTEVVLCMSGWWRSRMMHMKPPNYHHHTAGPCTPLLVKMEHVDGLLPWFHIMLNWCLHDILSINSEILHILSHLAQETLSLSPQQQQLRDMVMTMTMCAMTEYMCSGDTSKAQYISNLFKIAICEDVPKQCADQNCGLVTYTARASTTHQCGISQNCCCVVDEETGVCTKFVALKHSCDIWDLGKPEGDLISCGDAFGYASKVTQTQPKPKWTISFCM